ncbi:hypothetical protein AVEN_212739-1 [Araneus ventricosus]|uniref:Uncharacterized protein n=1 Tax=Araneus ventricosus TaxID=182803 RepID=A0A4Y2H173_ARAVE|nr:hypothetical protein AVEN_212739-1 [Araneus ventricosus]
MPTFIPADLKKGCPDLMPISSTIVDKLNQRGNLDLHSFSDHRLKEFGSPEVDVQIARVNYKKSRAEYRRELLLTKRKSWEQLYKGSHNAYRPIVMPTFGKTKKTTDIMVNPDGRPNITLKVRIKLLFGHFFSQTTSAIEITYKAYPESKYRFVLPPPQH